MIISITIKKHNDKSHDILFMRFMDINVCDNTVIQRRSKENSAPINVTLDLQKK